MRQSIKTIRDAIWRISRAIKALEDRRIDRWDAYMKAWKQGDVAVHPPSHLLSDYVVGLLVAKRARLKIALETLTEGTE
jgi:hypothetical protein